MRKLTSGLITRGLIIAVALMMYAVPAMASDMVDDFTSWFTGGRVRLIFFDVLLVLFFVWVYKKAEGGAHGHDDHAGHKHGRKNWSFAQVFMIIVLGISVVYIVVQVTKKKESSPDDEPTTQTANHGSGGNGKKKTDPRLRVEKYAITLNEGETIIFVKNSADALDVHTTASVLAFYGDDTTDFRNNMREYHDGDTTNNSGVEYKIYKKIPGIKCKLSYEFKTFSLDRKLQYYILKN